MPPGPGLQVHGLWKNEQGYIVRIDSELSVASGTEFDNYGKLKHHWIANIQRETGGEWSGRMFYQYASKLANNEVTIYTGRSDEGPISVSFKENGKNAVPFKERDLINRYFRTVYLEVAAEENVDYVTSYNTHEHPNRPNDLPNLNLTIENVFERAGIDIRIQEGKKDIPTNYNKYDDPEWDEESLNQAMSRYSTFEIDNYPLMPAIWFFNASRIYDDVDGGLMFDQQRHGAALFNNSDLFKAPSDDPAPKAWIRRGKFKSTIHEIGHCFNLYHTYDIEHGQPWKQLKNDYNASSFMGLSHLPEDPTIHKKFYADFHFTFTKEELLFMRHAPDEFVRMGNSPFGVNHG
ncbi:hypothetical protein [Priestia megaterium]|uniref:hypothetical protein n=1 Tax=Priestia megaterium TaxID=1404 RepID=UPI00366BC98F